MLPNISINPGEKANMNLRGSRAYTFLDAYAYSRNERYNFTYSKKKQILSIENDAVNLKDPQILYHAFVDQCSLLENLIYKVRQFITNIRPDIISNIQQIIPSSTDMDRYGTLLSNSQGPVEKVKYIEYNIQPIIYPDMNIFLNLFKTELKQYLTDHNNGVSMSNPIIHSPVTKFLKDNGAKYSTINRELLDMEEIKVLTLNDLRKKINFLKRKSNILQIINNDFKVIMFFLREFRFLDQFVKMLEPKHRDGKYYITINGVDTEVSFNEYFVIYRHAMTLSAYMLDLLSNYDKKFFCKVQAIQNNIETYRTLLTTIEYDNIPDDSDNVQLETTINSDDIGYDISEDLQPDILDRKDDE